MVYTPTVNDQLYVTPVKNSTLAPINQPVSLGQVLALAATGDAVGIIDTAITTVGNGTLTAAALIGGQVVRTGPTSTYTDTTDTAANIIAALPVLNVGGTFFIRIKNATAFTQTLAAGAGVTLPATVIIPAFSVGNYYATISTASTVTITHMNNVPLGTNIFVTAPALIALSTVGAGTITATAIVSGFTTRTGAQAATPFTDTTDTAANIISAQPGIVNKIGTAFVYAYQNTTNAVATITGGTGVTVSGISTAQANSTTYFLLTYTAAATLTMVGFSTTANPSIGTFTATGASAVTVANTAVSTNSQINFTLKTVGGTPAGQPFVATITPGTGFTVKAVAGDTSIYNYAITW